MREIEYILCHRGGQGHYLLKQNKIIQLMDRKNTISEKKTEKQNKLSKDKDIDVAKKAIDALERKR